MGVTSTYRFKIANQELGRKWGKVASETWRKAGASNVRAFTVMFGPNVGQWVFAIDFPDLAAYAKARNAVRATPEFKQWSEELPKAGNVVMDAGLLDDITF
jgi:NIPSNAP protein